MAALPSKSMLTSVVPAKRVPKRQPIACLQVNPDCHAGRKFIYATYQQTTTRLHIRPLTTVIILLRWLEEEQQVVLRLVLRKAV